MYKLVALDLDDTLLTTDKRVSERNRQALKACLEAGIDVVTASGRFNESQLVFIKEIGLGLEKKVHVGDGGGTIFTEAQVLETLGAFSPEVYQSVLDQARALELPCFVTNGENVYYDIPDQPLCGVYGRVKNVRRPYIFEIEDLGAVTTPLKLIFHYDNPEELARIYKISHPDIITFHAARQLMEITLKTLNKFDALKRLGERCGVTPQEMVCIGDSENDIPMVKQAGLGMVVKNALDTVKAQADVVGEKTNDEDGVAWLLEHYVLN
ncbi:MAG: HAD hydrolase family protein [Eubacterium sp.]|nr:HAD hydrolase family protein [Eubacterium sp.]